MRRDSTLTATAGALVPLTERVLYVCGGDGHLAIGPAALPCPPLTAHPRRTPELIQVATNALLEAVRGILAAADLRDADADEYGNDLRERRGTALGGGPPRMTAQRPRTTGPP